MILFLLAAIAFAEDEVGTHVIGDSSPGKYYSVTPMQKILEPPEKIVGITFNFDGTITMNDDLTIEILQRCSTLDAETLTHEHLSGAFDDLKEEVGEKEFIDKYFGGERRVKILKSALKKMRKATNGRVHILSASWGTTPKRPWLKNPIPEKDWAHYLLHLTNWVGLEFDEDHIIGVWAPGPPTVPEKGEFLEDFYKTKYNEAPTNVVHIDKFKYASRILAVGANLLQPDPDSKSHWVHQFSLNELLIKCGGSQVGTLDILWEHVFGSGDADSSGLYYAEQPSSTGTDLVVYGFAALGLASLVSTAWRKYQNRKLAEHVALQTSEPEL